MSSKHTPRSPYNQVEKSLQSSQTKKLLCGQLSTLHSGEISTRLKISIIVLFFGLMAIKAVAAVRLNLIGDEAFYFQCSQRMDICFVDHPFMTALLVRVGTFLAGDTTFGVRFMFLTLSVAIPMSVFWLARSLVGSRDAWLAMAASLLVVPLGLFSTLAIPDVPLIAFIGLGIAAFERATRRGGNLRWFCTGLLAALGLCTHYRFFPFLLAAFIYLAGTVQGRSCLKKQGPWIGLVVMSCGLFPSLLYNIRLNWSPALFQFVGRHNGGFKPGEIFIHPLEQMVTASPVMYVALLAVLVILWRRGCNGDDRSVLLAVFASTFMGGYFVLSPWSDTSNNHMHWPLPGYLPLFVFLPITLRYFVHCKPTLLRKATAVMAPALGGVLIFLALLDLSFGVLGLGFLNNSFIGWEQCGNKAREYLHDFKNQSDEPVIIVGDNYILAGQLEFYLPDNIEVYTFNHRRNRSHGREAQYKIWRADEQSLSYHVGQNALVVVEASARSLKNRPKWLAHISSFFESLEYIGNLEFPRTKNRKRIFHFYRGRYIINPTLKITNN